MVVNDFINFIKDRLRIHGYGEPLVCSKCGKEYTSTGKHDPNICPDCRYEGTFFGGPLDGKKTGDLYDDTRS